MNDFIIIPTYNERDNIASILDRVFSLYPAIRVVVVDDNSPDGTAEIVRRSMKKYPGLELYSRSAKKGLASAYIEAMRKILAVHRGVRAIITMDADFSHDPAVVGRMLDLIGHYDLVIGSRYVSGGRIAHWQWWRRIMSKLGNFYARTITATPIHDMTSGFHCFRADLLRSYDFNEVSSAGFAFLMEMKIIACRKGARILETPIVLTDRRIGRSKLTNHIIYEGLVLPWKLRLKYYKSS